MSSGLRISQAGIPFKKAADYQMVMDERWPLVEMAVMGVFEINVTIPNGATQRVVICKHNLDYLPMFTCDLLSYVGDLYASQIIIADTKNVYWRVTNFSGSPQSFNLKFFVCVIDRDCSKEFAAPIAIVTSTQTAQPSDYGLRIISSQNPGNIEDNNKSHFSINTNAKTFTVQMHGKRTANAGTSFQMTLIHRLGYPPSYFLTKIEDWDGVLHTRNARDLLGLAKSNSITLTMRGAQSALNGDFLFMILKDPVDLAR